MKRDKQGEFWYKCYSVINFAFSKSQPEVQCFGICINLRWISSRFSLRKPVLCKWNFDTILKRKQSCSCLPKNYNPKAWSLNLALAGRPQRPFYCSRATLSDILESRDCIRLKVSTWWLAISGSPCSHTVLLKTCALMSKHLKTTHVKRPYMCSLVASSQTRGGKIFVFVFPFLPATNQMCAACTVIPGSRKFCVPMKSCSPFSTGHTGGRTTLCACQHFAEHCRSCEACKGVNALQQSFDKSSAPACRNKRRASCPCSRLQFNNYSIIRLTGRLLEPIKQRQRRQWADAP